MSIEVPAKRLLQEADMQDLETLESLQDQKHYWVKFPYDPELGYRVENRDGTTALIARDVSINGVQFLIPADEKVLVPEQVLRIILEQSVKDGERFAVSKESLRLNDKDKPYRRSN